MNASKSSFERQYSYNLDDFDIVLDIDICTDNNSSCDGINDEDELFVMEQILSIESFWDSAQKLHFKLSDVEHFSNLFEIFSVVMELNDKERDELNVRFGDI